MKPKGTLTTVIAIVLICIAFSYLLVIGLRAGSMYYMKLPEFEQKKDTLAGERIRLNGSVVFGSVHFEARKQLVTFTLKNAKGSQTIPVVYHGTPPDLIGQKNTTVVAEGIYHSDTKIFMADKLLIKCPSKYEKREG